MISKKDLDEAIAEMQGQRHPDATTCLMLASYLTVRNYLFPDKQAEQHKVDRGYSLDSAPLFGASTIAIDTKTEFCDAVRGKPVNLVWQRLDDIMGGLKVTNPDLYKRILRDLSAI